ncbi:methylenetetrahydrofolate reductase [soil metagenome]
MTEFGCIPAGARGGVESARLGLERPRFELVPIKSALEAADDLPQGAEVTISCSPALGIENTLELAEELSERGFQVVPHLAARLVTGTGHLNKLLRRMDDSGLRDVFVVGGDSAEPNGPFSSGLDLLEAMSRREHGLERIGVPGYPEGHPLIDDERLTEALLDKQRFASYVVTQICFEPQATLGWLERIRHQGVSLPVYVGVPGAVERAKLLRVSFKIGIGNSLRFLRKQPGISGHLMTHDSYTPDDLVEGLSPYVGDADYGIRGFHINTFNQADTTERWRAQMLYSGCTLRSAEEIDG